jgi:ADP-heptose:LPS heptosyltransferase
MGDIAMTVPVIYSLAQQYPHIRITVLSRPFARCFFENLAPNVGFMEADFTKEYKGIKGLNALYRRLTAKNFTAVADLHDVLRTQYLRMRFCFDRHHVAHINKHRSGKRLLTKQTNKRFVQQPTSFQNYADVFAALGYPLELKFKSVFPPEGGDLAALHNKIGVKKESEKWIGIAPFAAHQGKIYPLANMKKVISMLINRHPDYRIFLFGGGKKEKEQLSEIAAEFPQCTNASMALNGLEEELILISHLNVMISMDSANMHLASLVNVPVVSIWGATHPYAGFMGWNQNPDNAVQIDLNCRPCSIYGNKPCLRGDYACIKNISPELVVQRTELALFKK